MRLEQDAVLIDLTEVLEAEALKPAAVGERRAVPAHESVQPTDLFEKVGPRSQVQVVRVAEHYLCPGGSQVNRVDGPDRTLGRHRHEERRGHVAASGAQHTSPRAAVGGLELERRNALHSDPRKLIVFTGWLFALRQQV